MRSTLSLVGIGCRESKRRNQNQTCLPRTIHIRFHHTRHTCRSRTQCTAWQGLRPHQHGRRRTTRKHTRQPLHTARRCSFRRLSPRYLQMLAQICRRHIHRTRRPARCGCCSAHADMQSTLLQGWRRHRPFRPRTDRRSSIELRSTHPLSRRRTLWLSCCRGLLDQPHSRHKDWSLH